MNDLRKRKFHFQFIQFSERKRKISRNENISVAFNIGQAISCFGETYLHNWITWKPIRKSKSREYIFSNYLKKNNDNIEPCDREPSEAYYGRGLPMLSLIVFGENVSECRSMVRYSNVWQSRESLKDYGYRCHSIAALFIPLIFI